MMNLLVQFQQMAHNPGENILLITMEVLSVGVGLFIMLYFQKAFLGFKESTFNFKFLICILAFTISTAASLLTMDTLVHVAATLLTAFIITFICNGSYKMRVLSTVILTIIGSTSEIIAGYVLMFANQSNLEELQTSLFFRLQGIMIARILMLIFVVLICMQRKAKLVNIPVKSWMVLLFLPICSFLVIAKVGEITSGGQNLFDTIYNLLVCSGIMVSNIAVFSSLEDQLSNQNNLVRMEFYEQQLISQADHYKELEASQVETHRIWHDIKHYLMGLSGYIEKGEIETAKKYLAELTGTVTNAMSVVDTGHHGIDALIRAKYFKAIERDVEMRWTIILPPELTIDGMDLCIILANALDNALEACDKISQDRKKLIEFKMGLHNQYLTISVKNTTASQAQIVNGIVETTKPDKKYHGYGLENIRSVVEKYDGNMLIYNQGEFFVLEVIAKNS